VARGAVVLSAGIRGAVARGVVVLGAVARGVVRVSVSNPASIDSTTVGSLGGIIVSCVCAWGDTIIGSDIRYCVEGATARGAAIRGAAIRGAAIRGAAMAGAWTACGTRGAE
jgi:hypothetical protein